MKLKRCCTWPLFSCSCCLLYCISFGSWPLTAACNAAFRWQPKVKWGGSTTKKSPAGVFQLLFNRIHIWPLMVDFLKLPLDPQTMKNAGFKALNLKIWVATPKKRRLWIPRMFIFFLLVCELSLKGKKVPQELDSQCLPEPLLAMALCVLPRVVMSRNLCRNHIFFLIYPKDHGWPWKWFRVNERVCIGGVVLESSKWLQAFEGSGSLGYHRDSNSAVEMGTNSRRRTNENDQRRKKWQNHQLRLMPKKIKQPRLGWPSILLGFYTSDLLGACPSGAGFFSINRSWWLNQPIWKISVKLDRFPTG